MRGLKITVRLCGDLGTPLRGDTLFGQLCWALAMRGGEEALKLALAGYTTGSPHLVVSDACPSGFLPKPELPAPQPDDTDLESFRRRKSWSKRRWLEAERLARPLLEAYRASDLSEPLLPEEVLQSHNTINRYTGTTGTGMFAPYQTWRLSTADVRSQLQDLYVLLDAQKLAQPLFEQMLDDVGKTGYGRDASLGLGKFNIEGISPWSAPEIAKGRPHLTLAPCSPLSGSLDTTQSFWRPFTRFGRHGGPVFSGKVFKTPLLLADTGAVFTFNEAPAAQVCAGQGLGGDGQLSTQIHGTVHQGYAPVIPLNLDGWHG